MNNRTTTRAVAVLGTTIAALLLGLFAGPAAGQDYTGTLELTVARFEMCIGEENTAEATGFDPGTDVVFTLQPEDAELGVATADDSGVAVLTFGVPDGVDVGDHELSAEGTTSANGEPQVSAVTVDLSVCAADDGTDPAGTGDTGDDQPGTDELSRTGTDLSGVLRVGVILLAAGAALLLASRKRHTGSTPAA